MLARNIALTALRNKTTRNQQAPRTNVNGTRAVSLEDYKNGNYTTVGNIIMQQQIAAARMQNSNQLFSGFHSFLGGTGSVSQMSSFDSIQQNNQMINGMLGYYSATLRQLQAQTAMQMSQFGVGAYGYGF